ncbi:MAG: pyruvate kinase [Acetobacteraceae bacterium]|nr:pyruvate kinase [Acetobacteraceae bacterium]
MRRDRKAKIVATLGPASSTPETIRALVEAGADVFRLNFSHGTHEDHRERYDTIRQIEQEVGRPIAVLQDLQGPKLRIGALGTAVLLKPGERYRFDLENRPGDERRAPLPHPEIFAALSPGTQLLVDDGKLRLDVEEAGGDFAVARVLTGGPLLERKGVSVVGAILPLRALTDKDRVDLEFGLKLGVDWVALSFVQRPEDLREVRGLVGDQARVMAKLEKPSAIDQLTAIVAESDAIMVARGDLGVEMLPEQVPPIQRRILRTCRAAGKPVIVATQMLESMINAPTPTRAEASDVATAIYDGTDAVMLSAESASGKYPVQAVSIMDRIIREVERDPEYRRGLDAAHPEPEPTIADTICAALSRSASVLRLAAMITYTSSGFTTIRAARERPASPILAMTPSVNTARRLALVWGTHPVVCPSLQRVSIVVELGCEAAVREGFAQVGDIVAIAAGQPFGLAGTTNLLRIARIEE